MVVIMIMNIYLNEKVCGNKFVNELKTFCAIPLSFMTAPIENVAVKKTLN